MLAGTIGSRPVGTPENARAREYVLDQLRLFGYDVRVQQTDARRADLGYTARVANIIAVKPGADKNGIAIVSHYDSSPYAPGAADDGLGVAVSLEAARVLAARQDRKHTLFILVTDAEESGLMGAAGLVTDRDVMARLNAYVNVEATGNSGTAILFETGPGNSFFFQCLYQQFPAFYPTIYQLLFAFFCPAFFTHIFTGEINDMICLFNRRRIMAVNALGVPLVSPKAGRHVITPRQFRRAVNRNRFADKGKEDIIGCDGKGRSAGYVKADFVRAGAKTTPGLGGSGYLDGGGGTGSAGLRLR